MLNKSQSIQFCSDWGQRVFKRKRKWNETARHCNVFC